VISVIIPAYNAEKTIAEQLEALESQAFTGEWELIVADNGSTDSTRRLAESYRDRIPHLKVVDASRSQGAAAARNQGARAAVGDFLAFCDADDRVDTEWLSAMVKALERNEFVTGGIDHDSLNPGVDASWHWRSHVTTLPVALRFLPYALSGNMAVSRDAFEAVGGFPEDLRAVGEDIAISWNLQLAGHELYFEPRAIVAYRHRHDSGSLWGQYRGFGIADPVLYRRFRDRGMPAERLRTVLAGYGRLLLKIPALLSRRKRPSAIRSIAKRWGRLQGSIRERVFYL